MTLDLETFLTALYVIMDAVYLCVHANTPQADPMSTRRTVTPVAREALARSR
jgi:hypothetical protein